MAGRIAVIVLHAAVGWALCGLSMGLGLATLTLTQAELLHTAVAPVAFAAVTWVYFRYFAYSSPAVTAAVFLVVVVGLDVVVVSLLIVGDFSIFASPLGTWLPLALIAAATWSTGRAMRGHGPPPRASTP